MIPAEQFLGNLRTAPLRNEGRYDNEILAEWNREQPKCAICGHAAQCENSHTLKRGRAGNMASQVYALPLCHSCHVEYETLSIEDYLAEHPNIFEIVTLNIERWADHFTCNDRTPAKKAKVPQKKNVKSDFKTSKFNEDMEYCRHCNKHTERSQKENKHEETCRRFT